jgi:hypothetical protein
MKQTKSNKLSLGKKSISKLHELEMRHINGGSSYPTYVSCVSAGCPGPTWQTRRCLETEVCGSTVNIP